MPRKKDRNLVIVESPAKARTLAAILGPHYEVRASVGHVRDLPKTRLGVDIESSFQPRYVVPREKQEIVRQLKQAAARAARVFLATDPDREGEAIAWHIAEAADLQKTPRPRVVFHEITEEAVRNAFRHPRDIDQRLVNAQQARRILDRLVGYQISPLLWKKVGRGLSAGRVQSVALRMVVEREREIAAFQPQECWTIDARLARDDGREPFVARLWGISGKRKKLQIGSRGQADALLGALRSARFTVKAVTRKEQHGRPQPPFTTSTLQQEASRRLGFSARHTMAVAQQLYEGLHVPGEGEVGLITYMRTDSTHVAESAVAEARAYIAESFGSDLVPPTPRVYRKKAKGAQEAHEAIRPTSPRRDPESLRGVLKRDQYRLYSLIWRRMLASQMKDALYDVTSVEIDATPPQGEAYVFRASETALRFPGYRLLYQAYGDEEEEADRRRGLPELATGDRLRLLELLPEQHFTEPPPRYTEATLVKAMEENGIGRPSTYAPILSTIQQRGYIERDGRYLKPKELGFVVNDLLVTYFPDIFEVGFTAVMEEELDEIAGGQREWQPVVRDFFEPLQAALARAVEAPPLHEETGEPCPQCGCPLIVRWGRFGRFLACSGFPDCHYTRPLEEHEERPQVAPNEFCDLCGSPMVIRRGRYGRFLACSNYPQCRRTRRLLAKTGVACPECGGDIVARRTRRGRTFYGCSNYPRCRFTAWSRPLAEKCPQCGGPLVAQPAGRGRCLKCAWKGELPSRLAGVPA